MDQQENKLFVGNISWNATNEDLKEFFSQVGEVVDAVIINNKHTGRSKGFGFVTMKSAEAVDEAIEKLNGQELDGRALIVSKARPREERPE
jgi:nucleolin